MPDLAEVSKSWLTFKRGLRVKTYQPLTARVGKQTYDTNRP
jgi:hypothetical protein